MCLVFTLQVKCLPLPTKLQEAAQSLEMADFYIDPEHLRSSHHLSHSYPATCMIDNKPVTLKVTPRGKQYVPKGVMVNYINNRID